MRLSEYEMVKISDACVVIRSNKHVDTLSRNCCEDNSSGYFCCNSCSGCIAFEEECEHSIIVNNNKLILSHFGNRHVKRASCQGSYSVIQNIEPVNVYQDMNVDFNQSDDAYFEEDISSACENDNSMRLSNLNKIKALPFH